MSQKHRVVKLEQRHGTPSPREVNEALRAHAESGTLPADTRLRGLVLALEQARHEIDESIPSESNDSLTD